MTTLFSQLPKGLMFASVLLFLGQAIFLKPVLTKRSDYLPPPKIIKNMALGLNVQFSDSFWLRAIQDFDFCDQPVSAKECKGKSWLFDVLDLTTDLDKSFFHAYVWGGLALTIIISDYAGASMIFDKGVMQFPDEWHLNYAAAYHALFEEKNKVKAAKLYFTAANNGAPAWIRVMAGRLAAEGGEKEFSNQILSTMVEMSDDPTYIERLRKKIKELENK